MSKELEGPKILIVDDSPEDREIYRRRLNRGAEAAYEVIEADSGEEGLALCQSESPDCVLLDFNLPDTNGLDFLSDLAKANEELITPVIMMTGQGNESVAVEAMKQGASDYLVKGNITSEDIRRAITNAIEKASLHRVLKQKQEELAQFAHVAAYEIREPLRIVSGLCEYLKGDYHGKLDVKADGYLDRIVDACDHMVHTVQRLLDYAETGLVEGRISEFDLRAVVQAAIGSLDRTIKMTSAHIDIGPMPTLWGSQSGLIQVFQNLIDNALKFRGKNPPRVEIRARDEDTHWHITVADNGLGIEEEFHTAVFAPLRRLYEEEYPGTGLGLATCRKIVEAHAGQIWVESDGPGSTFHFTLFKRLHGGEIREAEHAAAIMVAQAESE